MSLSFLPIVLSASVIAQSDALLPALRDRPTSEGVRPQAMPLRELDGLLRKALDADLRADWDGLVDARERIDALAPEIARPGVIDYHLGYVDWRLSSLAYVVGGTPATVPLLERALKALDRAVAADPAHADAQALRATAAAMLAMSDPARANDFMAVFKSAWPIALEHGAANPRVRLLRAMAVFYMPRAIGGDPDRGLAEWREAIALLDRERVPGGQGRPVWGRAEAWAWMGSAYLFIGRADEARAALARAVELRGDFWWARAALAQATRPQR